VNRRAVHLGFSPNGTTLSSDDGGVVAVGPSPAALADACFRHDPPTAVELERAIDIVEDALMAAKAPPGAGAGLTTFEPTLRRLPGLELVGATLSRDAVEMLFQQLASIALGMPAPQGSTLTDRVTAAALLIVRESMHHLDFGTIRIEQAPLAPSSRGVNLHPAASPVRRG
jgi:GTPase involved in cell partitioning and DNA repair